jgi:acyl-CoA thioester hydrolase
MDTELAKWPVAVEIPVAWGDMDSFGHVNNTVYLRWFETARIAYFERTGVVDRMESEGVGPILARTSIDFRLPVQYPDSVRAEATVTRIGKTSFVMGYRVLSTAHGGAVAAEGDGVVVMLDYVKGEKVPLSETERLAIRDLEASAIE